MCKFIRQLAMAVAAIGLAPTAAEAVDARLDADTAILSPVLDDVNLGAAESLPLHRYSTVLLRFDLSTLPQGVASDSIVKATLHLFVTGLQFGGDISVAPVTSDWSELDVLFSTAPSIGAAVATAIVEGNGYVTVDVTGQVREWVTAPSSNRGLALSTGTANVLLDSKENKATSHPAKLDITVAEAPASSQFVKIAGFAESNTAAGAGALRNVNSGGGTASNTAFGSLALTRNSDGFANTAIGAFALQANTTGRRNTAVGSVALSLNSTGDDNTASGSSALSRNTTGKENTATGSGALALNTEGLHNTAAGSSALALSKTGSFNTAAGSHALEHNDNGDLNTALGSFALRSNNVGTFNTAVGADALARNNVGELNTAVGGGALAANTEGTGNVAIGTFAGERTTGDFNIAIGHQGVAGESNTIRIGTPGRHGAAFVAGIYRAGVTGGLQVFVNADGRLGTPSSSRRYKEDIQEMGGRTSGLMQLRPVVFRYKEAAPDGSKPLEFGLIAEEVAAVYPDLVTYSPAGDPDTVQYHKLNVMLLNELQKQDRLNHVQEQKIHSLEERVADLERLLQGRSAE